MDVLQRAEKGQKRRSAKVGDRSEAGEEAAVPHLLEAALTHILGKKGNIRDGKYAVHTTRGRQWRSHQHGGAQVKLLRHLGDVCVDRDELLGVQLLHLPDDVRHPLKLMLRPRHPDEVNLQHVGKKLRSPQGDEDASRELGNSGTFLHLILDLAEDLKTRSFKMEANGVTPIPPPTRTDTS